jgi:hypothetical protein
MKLGRLALASGTGRLGPAQKQMFWNFSCSSAQMFWSFGTCSSGMETESFFMWNSHKLPHPNLQPDLKKEKK